MKQRLQSSIILLLLLLSSSSLFAQSFTIVSPVSKQLHYVTSVGGHPSDSLRIKNNTNAPIDITISTIGTAWTVYYPTKKVTISANTTKSIFFMLSQPGETCAGTANGNIVISDTKGTTDQIGLSLDCRSYGIYGKSIGRQSLCFTNTPLNTTACQTVWARNSLTEPIIISKLGFNYNDQPGLSVKAHGTNLPIVILPGEEIAIADVCYTPVKINSSVFEWLTITYTPNNTTSGIISEVDIYASSERDTNLLKPCLVASVDTAFVGPILFGGSIDKTIQLRNNRYGSLTVDSVSIPFGDINEFTVIGLPITINPLSSKSVTLRFSPQQASSIVKFRYAIGLQFNINGSGTTDSLGNPLKDNCQGSLLTFAGLAMVPTADSIATPLMADKEYDLGMIGSSPSFSQDFHFDNTTNNKIKIVNVSLANTASEFSIANISPSNTLPLTLNPGEKLTVTVQFTPSATNQVFFNQLVITTEAGLQSLTYPIQGMRVNTASVPVVLNGSASMSVTPNPVKDMVSINVSNVESSSIEIYDLLGKRVFKMNNATTLSLNVRDLQLQSGVYLVRATGREASGYDYTLTSKLIVE